jgi:DNA-binding transcriptional ArsR family regulator
MIQTDRPDAAQQALTALATGLHTRMRACDGEVCLELLVLLADGERRVGHLAKMLSLDMPAISARLAAMKRRGLVMSRIAGSKRFYSLSSLVKVVTRGRFRAIDVRASGGGEVQIAVPLKLMRQLSSKWTLLESRVAKGAQISDVVEPEIRSIDLNELANRVARVDTRRADANGDAPPLPKKNRKAK